MQHKGASLLIIFLLCAHPVQAMSVQTKQVSAQLPKKNKKPWYTIAGIIGGSLLGIGIMVGAWEYHGTKIRKELEQKHTRKLEHVAQQREQEIQQLYQSLEQLATNIYNDLKQSSYRKMNAATVYYTMDSSVRAFFISKNMHDTWNQLQGAPLKQKQALFAQLPILIKAEYEKNLIDTLIYIINKSDDQALQGMLQLN